jgi:hypothetical protein
LSKISLLYQVGELKTSNMRMPVHLFGEVVKTEAGVDLIEKT